MVLGTWLDVAGPLGAVLGFALGGALMLLIGLCYAELMTTLPAAGGEVVYAYYIYGVEVSFVVGWFLALVYAAVTAFEAISLAWVLEALLPGSQGPVLYSVLGADVTLGSLIIGVVTMFLLIMLNYRGTHAVTRFQDLFTFALIAAAALFLIAGIGWGTVENLRPVFQTGGSRPAWTGVLWVFATSPLWFSGFQVVTQVMEERAPGTSPKSVGWMVLMAIGMALIFYWLVIIAAAMAAPRDELLGARLPLVTAMEAAFGNRVMAQVVLLAAVFGILTTWNAVIVVGARLLFSMGRAAMIPSTLGRVHPRFGSPALAVLLIGAVGTVGVFLGRNALVPIVNIGASCFAFTFVISAWGVVRLRRTEPHLERPYRVPGGIATAVLATGGAGFVLVYSLYETFAAADGGIPLEWIVLVAWGALGVGFWLAARRIRTGVSETDRRRLMLGAITNHGYRSPVTGNNHEVDS